MLNIEKLNIRLGDFSLEDLSLKVHDGEYLVLLGISGVGKTVLLEMIAGLIPPDSGRIYLGQNEITHERIQHRAVGLVYQDQALFPHMTARQNIGYGLRKKRLSRTDREKRIRELAETVGIGHLLKRNVRSFSGGEAQRVALARTLATEPGCILLDEPLSSLDVQAKREMRSLLRRIHGEGNTILHVTHDYEEAASLATQVAVMEQGHIVQCGSIQDVFQHPRSEFVARFTGIRNYYPGELLATTHEKDESALFSTGDLQFSILTDEKAGPGSVMIRSEDVVLSAHEPDASTRNTFHGRIVDIEPARLGIEVMVDIGIPVSSLITANARKSMKLEPGSDVWVSFKASAARFIGN